MRRYAKISPQLWIGDTGRQLRNAGPEALLVALYLLSNPHANMLGLYYLPTSLIAHETGLAAEGASKGLQGAIEAGFCSYDESSEMVFVHEMARYQIADQLATTDKQCTGIQRQYDALPNNPFLAMFYKKYANAFHLATRRENRRVSEGASMTHRSQEQEQEQDQDLNTFPQTKFAESNGVLSHERKNSKPTEAQTERLYSLYPRKRDKLDAKKAIWKAAGTVMAGDSDHPAMELDDALNYLAERVALYARCVQGRDQNFIPYPASWFNAGSFWDDEQDWVEQQRDVNKNDQASRKVAQYQNWLPPQNVPNDYISEGTKRKQAIEANKQVVHG
jgi:hypothetical protein